MASLSLHAHSAGSPRTAVSSPARDSQPAEPRAKNLSMTARLLLPMLLSMPNLRQMMHLNQSALLRKITQHMPPELMALRLDQQALQVSICDLMTTCLENAPQAMLASESKARCCQFCKCVWLRQVRVLDPMQYISQKK